MNEDGLSVARGLAIGLGVSAVLWLVMVAACVALWLKWR